MPVRLFIAWSLFIPCAATIGCVPSAEPEVDKGTRTTLKVLAPPRRVAEGEADKKKAAEEKAAEKKVVKEKVTVNGYVKVKVEVELCGLLSCAEGAITISTDEKHHWTLDFGEDKETRTRAKNLEGKTVLVKGMAILHGIRKPEIPRERGIRDYRRDTISPRILSQQAVQLSSEVVAKSLVLAPED